MVDGMYPISLNQFLGKFYESIETASNSSNEWAKLMTSQTPEKDQIPRYNGPDTPFFHAIIIRCLRPDRVIFASNKYISETLGNQFMELSVINTDNIADEAGINPPVIYLLSAGSDSTPLVEEAARKAKMNLNKITIIKEYLFSLKFSNSEDISEKFRNQNKLFERR
jgi:dynein heavy chain